ncbi:hypothetical protein WJX73_001810 [Symbiochloris irregularis]|uniref:Uncharacterized protein n=1 Tax=Symbiochloris irregularis TaxID=706552 RepID=A0AAW1PBT5_9CHLO
MIRQPSDVSSAQGASDAQISPEPAAQTLSSGQLPSLSALTDLNVAVEACMAPLDTQCSDSPNFSCSGSLGPEEHSLLMDLLGGFDDRMPLRLSKIMEERLSADMVGMDLDMPCEPSALPSPASPKCEASSTDTASDDQDSGMCVTQGTLATGSHSNEPETVHSAPAALQRGSPTPSRPVSPGKRKVSWDEHSTPPSDTAADRPEAEAKARASDQQNQMLQHYVRQLDAQRTQLSSQAAAHAPPAMETTSRGSSELNEALSIIFNERDFHTGLSGDWGASF